MIYGKDILDSVYALAGKFFEKDYKVNHEETYENDADSGKGNIPFVSLMHEEIMADLSARMPFVLATVCNDLSVLDRAYRMLFAEAEQADFSSVFISLDEPFPLSERFLPSVVLYCASMLLIDLDSEASDKLFEKYADSVSEIAASLPCLQEHIVQKY